MLSSTQNHSQLEMISAREREILALMIEGMSSGEIAVRLYLSIHTVKTHTRSIIRKLEVNNRIQAVVKAVRGGLVP